MKPSAISPASFVFVVFFACLSVHGQNLGIRNSGVPDLAAELLRLPVAHEENRAYWDNILHFIHPQREPQRRPKEDASLHVLAEYWRHKFVQDPDRLPDALRVRLLKACEAYPEYAADLAHLVPRTPEANQRLLALLNRVSDNGDEYSPRHQIVRYLSQNGDWFRPQLIGQVRAAYEGEGFIENESDVRALARLDWGKAAPLIVSMIRADKPRMTALALGLQYQHAVQSSAPETNRLRRRLKTLAMDRSAPAKARDLAMEALMTTEWLGREDWFISLLADGSLAEPTDHTGGFSPLEDPVHRDPSRWIPRIAPLVDSPNPSVRKNAIYILISFQQEEVRPDAAIPLLPWLFDPMWAEKGNTAHSRHNLIYSLSRMKVSESIPGLLHVLQHPEEDETFEIEYAANALSQFRDEHAIPVLRQLLVRDIDHRDRLAVAKALIATGVVTLEEKVQAVAAVARQVTKRAGREQLNQAEMDDEVNTIEGQVVLGLAVVEAEGEQAALVKAVGRHSQEVRASDPETADSLDAILAVLPDAERDAKLVTAIGDGTADAATILIAIERRAWLYKNNSAALKALAKGNGSSSAIAALLLEDDERELEILLGEDVVAQKTLLASLRLSGDLAHDDAVEKLTNSPNPELAQAANAYREILWRGRHTL